MNMSETQQTRESDAPLSEGAGQSDAKVTTPSDATSSVPDASSQGKELEVLNQIMGRNFKTLEEARDHYQNLNKLVGDNTIAEQRRAAQSYDSLIDKISKENNWSRAATIAYLDELQTSSEKPPVSFDAKAVDDNQRVQKLERDLFLVQTPEAVKYLDKIEAYSKASKKTLRESYEELYGDILKETKEQALSEAVRQEKLGAQVNASTNTPAPPDPNRYAELMEKYKKTGNSEFLREAMKEKWNKNESLKKASE